MAKKSRKRRKGTNRTELAVTPITKHQRIGKRVVPPLAKLKKYPGFTPTDWTATRLPEMLWASLLLVCLGRDEALHRFRRLGRFIEERSHADESRRTALVKVTLSGIASWSEDEFEAFSQIVIGNDAAIFSALTVFEELPGLDSWKRAVGDLQPDFDALKAAVAATLWHQSQESTDCRWMRVLAMLLSGSLKFPRGAEDLVREILAYPDYGDQRKVRPLIRSTEGSADMTPSGLEISAWSPAFWQRAFELTIEDHGQYEIPRQGSVGVPTLESVRSTRAALCQHARDTTTDTSVDARHEGTFGLAAYAVDLLVELLSMANSSSILGRMGLRSLTEILINLSTLATRDTPERWKDFRDYGYGQAKLTYLKMLEVQELPAFVTVEALEQLSNEDIWHEFREMKLGNWNDSDLRSMAATLGLKSDIYDKYYDWSSAFVHANWAAVRDAEFVPCLNPLHRMHRILSERRAMLPDVIQDCATIVNRVLALVDTLYPPFAERIEIPEVYV